MARDDQLTHVTKDDRPTVERENRLIDAASVEVRGAGDESALVLIPPAGLRAPDDHCVIRVRNNSGDRLEAYSILAIDRSAALETGPSDDLDEFQRFPIFEGNTPVAPDDDGNFCILIEAIDADEVGKAVVCGEIPVQVEFLVGDGWQEYADVMDDTTDRLGSYPMGAAQILWREDDPDPFDCEGDSSLLWCLVRLGNASDGPTAFARLMEDLPGNGPAWAKLIKPDPGETACIEVSNGFECGAGLTAGQEPAVAWLRKDRKWYLLNDPCDAAPATTTTYNPCNFETCSYLCTAGEWEALTTCSDGTCGDPPGGSCTNGSVYETRCTPGDTATDCICTSTTPNPIGDCGTCTYECQFTDPDYAWVATGNDCSAPCTCHDVPTYPCDVSSEGTTAEVACLDCGESTSSTTPAPPNGCTGANAAGPASCCWICDQDEGGDWDWSLLADEDPCEEPYHCEKPSAMCGPCSEPKAICAGCVNEASGCSSCFYYSEQIPVSGPTITGIVGFHGDCSPCTEDECTYSDSNTYSLHLGAGGGYLHFYPCSESAGITLWKSCLGGYPSLVWNGCNSGYSPCPAGEGSLGAAMSAWLGADGCVYYPYRCSDGLHVSPGDDFPNWSIVPCACHGQCAPSPGSTTSTTPNPTCGSSCCELVCVGGYLQAVPSHKCPGGCHCIGEGKTCCQSGKYPSFCGESTTTTTTTTTSTTPNPVGSCCCYNGTGGSFCSDGITEADCSPSGICDAMGFAAWSESDSCADLEAGTGPCGTTTTTTTTAAPTGACCCDPGCPGPWTCSDGVTESTCNGSTCPEGATPNWYSGQTCEGLASGPCSEPLGSCCCRDADGHVTLCHADITEYCCVTQNYGSGNGYCTGLYGTPTWYPGDTCTGGTLCVDTTTTTTTTTTPAPDPCSGNCTGPQVGYPVLHCYHYTQAACGGSPISGYYTTYGLYGKCNPTACSGNPGCEHWYCPTSDPASCYLYGYYGIDQITDLGPFTGSCPP